VPSPVANATIATIGLIVTNSATEQPSSAMMVRPRNFMRSCATARMELATQPDRRFPPRPVSRVHEVDGRPAHGQG
jgi:hypothetical protein